MDNIEVYARYELVIRVAKAMVERNGDEILAKCSIITKRAHEDSPIEAEQLDSEYRKEMIPVKLPKDLLEKCTPCALTVDDGRVYPYVRGDGTGQLTFKWTSGMVLVYKFILPDEYLSLNKGTVSNKNIERHFSNPFQKKIDPIEQKLMDDFFPNKK